MSSDDNSAPPQPAFTTGVSTLFTHASLHLPPADAAAAPAPPARRSHRAILATPDATYEQTLRAITREAREAVNNDAVSAVVNPTTVTEEQLEEWEVDQPLLQESVARLKQRLSIKIREQEALAARIRVGRAAVAARKKKEKEERMALLRTRRLALMRQRSEEQVAAAAFPMDLTTQGIEPNPSVQSTARASLSMLCLHSLTVVSLCACCMFVCVCVAAVPP